MSGERTENPTERRRDEARRRGQGVGRSHELSQVMTLVAGLMALSSMLPTAATKIAETIQHHVLLIGEGTSVGPAALVGDLGDAFQLVVSLVVPLGVAVMVAGVAGSLAGGGFVISLGAVRFDGSRLNPLNGLRRMVDKSALTRLGIALAKLAILGAVSWQVISSRVPGLLATDGRTGSQIAGGALSAIFDLGVTIAMLLAAVALADWVLERRKANNALRMTKDEVRQEHREQEGDPQVRAQRRARARRLAFARMMDDVARADVVVVNPIRLAVALRYDPRTMRAPRIVGKGQRLMAARIREVAKANDIPIVEDVPLARALFPKPVGSEVPADLYRAVARILALVARLRAGTAGSVRTAPPRRAQLPAGQTQLPSWFGGAAR